MYTQTYHTNSPLYRIHNSDSLCHFHRTFVALFLVHKRCRSQCVGRIPSLAKRTHSLYINPSSFHNLSIKFANCIQTIIATVFKIIFSLAKREVLNFNSFPFIASASLTSVELYTSIKVKIIQLSYMNTLKIQYI